MTEIAKLLLKEEAVILRPQKPFTFDSGIKSPIYCDNRMLLGNPKSREKIVKYFVSKIKEKKISVDVIAGIATAGIPWAALIAHELKKPMAFVRKEKKDHGRENLIEGAKVDGKNVLLIEDLVSTGGSSIKGVIAVREQGGIVNNCLSIFTYQMTSSIEGFSKEKCELDSLSNFSELIEVAKEQGYIKEKDLDIVKKWNQNPKEWQK